MILTIIINYRLNHLYNWFGGDRAVKLELEQKHLDQCLEGKTPPGGILLKSPVVKRGGWTAENVSRNTARKKSKYTYKNLINTNK